jgi:hypothetical protein
MSISVADFWRLLVESRLLSVDEARQSVDELSRKRPDAAKDLQQVAKSLIQAGKITLYQAKVLAAGKPGPFVYGNYVVYDRVESPGLSSLLRARHQPTKHPVCLSFLSGQALDNPQALVRLIPQLAVARQASLAQPRLSGCHEFVDTGAAKFLVVEDLRGNSLDERLKNPEARLSIAAVCRLMRMVALGAGQLHSMGQAHGHLRPGNIWLDESGAGKLLQFPLISDPLSAKPPPVSVEAQLDFLAPELANPAALADPRSDVYSLGCLLYALLAGQPPFAGGDRQSKLDRHGKETPAAITQLNPQTPAALAQVLGYLLQKDPARRYPDANAVAEALQAYSGADPQVAREPTFAAYEAWLERGDQAPPATQPAAQAAAPIPSAAAVARAVSSNGGAVPAQAAASPATPAHAPAGAVPMAQPAGFPTAAVAVAAPAAVGQPVRAVYPTTARPVGSPPVAMAAPAMPMISVAAPVIAAANGEGSIAQRRPRKSGQTAATIGVIAVAVVVLGGIVLFLNSEKGKELAPSPETPTAVTAASGSQTPSPATSNDEEASPKSLDAQVADKNSGNKEPVQGIGGPIWQSPTAGEPLSLSWLPPGVQVVLALRPAELTQQPEWEKLADKRTLGTLAVWLTDDLPKATGQAPDQLESVLVGLLDGSPGPPKVALVARASEEFSLDDLQAGWGEPKPEEIEGQVIHVQSGRAFYIPPSGADKLLVIAPATELRDMLKTGGESPPLRREVEILAESSDDQRHLTLLAAPNFPLTDGKALFVDEGVKLLEPLRDFLEMQDTDGKMEMTKATLFSCHLGDSLFLELRMYDNFGRPAQSAAREIEHRVAALPKQVSGYVRDLQLSTYSKPILWDFKDQLDLLHKYTRLGVEGKQIVLRAYLPLRAAHNLALAAHLALLEVPGSGAPAAVASTPGGAKPLTVAERLKKKTTLSFPRNTLEQSMKLLGDDIGVEIIILGNDLREEGITKNQSFGLDEKDQPADEILRKIMKLANPDGKLVYTIKAKEGGGEDVLYITTRAAVKKRADKLPPELETK